MVILFSLSIYISLFQNYANVYVSKCVDLCVFCHLSSSLYIYTSKISRRNEKKNGNATFYFMLEIQIDLNKIHRTKMKHGKIAQN